MIISCEKCETRFVVPPQAIGITGRRVQCSKCNHVWFQDPPEKPDQIVPEKVIKREYPSNPEEKTGEIQPETPPDDEEAETDDSENQEEEDMKDFGDDFSKNVPAIVEKRSKGVIIGWVLLVLLLAGSAFSLYYFRDQIEDRWVVAETLYSKWDYLVLGKKPEGEIVVQKPEAVEDPHPSNNISLRQAAEVRPAEEGFSLYITLEIQNSGNEAVTLPLLEGVLRDAEGEPLFTWSQSLQPAQVAGNSIQQYNIIIDNIPEETSEAQLDLDWENDF